MLRSGSGGFTQWREIECGFFDLRSEKLEVAISIEPPSSADLRRNGITAKAAFRFHLAAERRIAEGAAFCLVSPAQQPDLSQPAIGRNPKSDAGCLSAHQHFRFRRLILSSFTNLRFYRRHMRYRRETFFQCQAAFSRA